MKIFMKEFTHEEVGKVRDLLQALEEQGVPETFSNDEGLYVAYDKKTDTLFLGNAENQKATLKDGKLEEWHFCVECGREGFAEDIGWTLETSCCRNCG